MGSRKYNSEKINQSHNIFRNIGNSKIELSNIDNDSVITYKYSEDYDTLLSKFETSIRSMSSRVLWLDASTPNDMTFAVDLFSGAEFISEWRDKINPSILTETSGNYGLLPFAPTYNASAVNAFGTIRGGVIMNGPEGLSFGHQLNPLINGKPITTFVVCKFRFEGADTFQEIISKYVAPGEADPKPSFYIYVYDADEVAPADYAVYRTEMYTDGTTYDNGINIESSNLHNNRENKLIILTSIINTNALDSRDIIKQNINREDDSSEPFVFGDIGNGKIAATNSIVILGNNDNGYPGLKGELYEVLIFNETLDSNTLEMVENYLALKWGIVKDIPKLRAGVQDS